MGDKFYLFTQVMAVLLGDALPVMDTGTLQPLVGLGSENVHSH